MNFNGEIKIKVNLWGGLVRSAVFVQVCTSNVS